MRRSSEVPFGGEGRDGARHMTSFLLLCYSLLMSFTVSELYPPRRAQPEMPPVSGRRERDRSRDDEARGARHTQPVPQSPHLGLRAAGVGGGGDLPPLGDEVPAQNTVRVYT